MLLIVLMALSTVNADIFNDVKNELKNLMPAPASHDDGHYGPFFIRLAWHCAGTYRTIDGRGGCDGARIRFPPESEWGSNKRLNEALALLRPVKMNFPAVSWADIIVLVGNVAIEEMGGPQIQFCGGRIDEPDGNNSKMLDNADIYLPGNEDDVAELRSSFKIMDMSDRETVALIGGGHSFGRCHLNTSGFDGPWTTNPTNFDNEFFINLLERNYTEELARGNPPGLDQFYDGSLMMLKTDLALIHDESYLRIVREYAEDASQFKIDFGRAWEKLINRDLGNKNCHVEDQYQEPLLNYSHVKSAIQAQFTPANLKDWGGLYIRLAWHCAGTFRITDYNGGCNGARIRYSPEKDWGSNINIDNALGRLQEIKTDFGPNLSWADLIIISGNAAIEEMGGLPMEFCHGRLDETDGNKSAYLNPEIYLDAQTGTAQELRETMEIMGFNDREMTVLNGGGHAIGQSHAETSGFGGPWTHTPDEFSNNFFQLLLSEEWIEETSSMGKLYYTDNKTKSLTMFHTDLEFRRDPEFKKIVQEYANDNNLFLTEFRDAWTKLVNADRFGTVCIKPVTMDSSSMDSSSSSASSRPPTPQKNINLPTLSSSSSSGIKAPTTSVESGGTQLNFNFAFMVLLGLVIILL